MRNTLNQYKFDPLYKQLFASKITFKSLQVFDPKTSSSAPVLLIWHLARWWIPSVLAITDNDTWGFEGGQREAVWQQG